MLLAAKVLALKLAVAVAVGLAILALL